MPTDYQQVLTTLGRPGDYKAHVLKVNIPRSDVNVTVANVQTPTPFGFGGWIAMTKGAGGMDVMMGDLVLLQDEVNPVMSALLENGLDVTALHNHFFWDEPRMFYMHVHGHGKSMELARKVKPALDLIGRPSNRPTATPSPPVPPSANSAGPANHMDTARIAKIVGHEGEQTGAVYKITIGRDDLKVAEMGAPINARMGLNTWAAFVGTDEHAAVAGDVAMVASEVTPVLKALRKNGLDVVSIHHHMTNTRPTIVFLHYWGTGPIDKLAAGFTAALSELGARTTGPHTSKPPQADAPAVPQKVVFVCEHGAARSVIAAAYFNKLARERQLNIHAIARGTTTQPELSTAAVAGLQRDGIAFPRDKPRSVTARDVRGAVRVVAFWPLPESLAKQAPVDSFEVPAPGEGYDVSRDAILVHVKELIDELSISRRP